jgi:GNAT superfamily N-acetyltransferase
LKGQRLFIRLARAEDRDEIGSFYAEEQSVDSHAWLEQDAPGGSLIGKLVGDVVAHLNFSRSDGSLSLEHIYVARLLRRKQIGRFMISELARLAGSEGATGIDAPTSCAAVSFLLACGFERSADDTILTMKIDLEENP